MATPVKSEDAGSAAATPDTGKPPPQPSLAEAYFFLNIIKYVRGKLDVDWAAVAQESGFKNAETAKVRFGQVKKKLGFNNSTPAAARVRPGAKRGANDDGGDSSAAAPAEKKPRKTPAKPRGKKAQAAAAAAAAATSTPDTTGAPVSSPAASDTESPLAAKSKVYQNIGPMPGRLKDGSAYALSAGNIAGNGYSPYGTVNPADMASETGYAKAEKIDAAVKPEPSSDDDDEGEDDEAEQNARHKVELYKQINNQEKQQVAQATQAYDNNNRSFGPPNNFPVVNMMAPSPFNHHSLPQQHQQVQGVTKQQRQRTPLRTSASPRRQVSASPRQHVSASPRQQMRHDAVQQAMVLAQAQQGHGHGRTATTNTATASTASLRQGQGQQGGGGVTHQQQQQQQPQQVPVKKREVEVEEDMTLPSAFAEAMYGVDHEEDVGGYGWSGF